MFLGNIRNAATGLKRPVDFLFICFSFFGGGVDSKEGFFCNCCLGFLAKDYERKLLPVFNR